MKQHITKGQLLSLTDEQKEKLRELWEPNLHDVVLIKKENNNFWRSSIHDMTLNRETLTLSDITEEYDEVNVSEVLPLLSIGQMIEILNDYKKDIYFNQDSTIIDCELGIDGITYRSKELVDALFEAIKEVL